MVPSLTEESVASALSSVVLPAPLRPKSNVSVPASNVTETSSRMVLISIRLVTCVALKPAVKLLIFRDIGCLVFRRALDKQLTYIEDAIFSELDRKSVAEGRRVAA